MTEECLETWFNKGFRAPEASNPFHQGCPEYYAAFFLGQEAAFSEKLLRLYSEEPARFGTYYETGDILLN